MKVPIRIYYDIETGHVIQMTGNFIDAWLKKYDSIEEQIPKYQSLSERNRDTFDVIELPFGSYEQDFNESKWNFRVNPKTKELEFSYPDPNAPEEPQPYVKPLTEQLLDIKTELYQANQAILNGSIIQEELLDLLIEMGVL